MFDLQIPADPDVAWIEGTVAQLPQRIKRGLPKRSLRALGSRDAGAKLRVLRRLEAIQRLNAERKKLLSEVERLLSPDQTAHLRRDLHLGASDQAIREREQQLREVRERFGEEELALSASLAKLQHRFQSR